MTRVLNTSVSHTSSKPTSKLLMKSLLKSLSPLKVTLGSINCKCLTTVWFARLCRKLQTCCFGNRLLQTSITNALMHQRACINRLVTTITLKRVMMIAKDKIGPTLLQTTTRTALSAQLIQMLTHLMHAQRFNASHRGFWPPVTSTISTSKQGHLSQILTWWS